MTNPAPEPPSGFITSIVNALKGLTIGNALVIVLLATVLVPSYLLYRVITEPELLDRFLSSYKVYGNQVSACTLRKVKQRGEDYTYVINTGFAFEGGSRWSMAVSLNWEPTDEQVRSYCDTLEKLVDHMREPSHPPPTVPGTDQPLVVPYKDP